MTDRIVPLFDGLPTLQNHYYVSCRLLMSLRFLIIALLSSSTNLISRGSILSSSTARTLLKRFGLNTLTLNPAIRQNRGNSNAFTLAELMLMFQKNEYTGYLSMKFSIRSTCFKSSVWHCGFGMAIDCTRALFWLSQRARLLRV
jgi:hypothetical protein